MELLEREVRVQESIVLIFVLMEYKWNTWEVSALYGERAVLILVLMEYKWNIIISVFLGVYL